MKQRAGGSGRVQQKGHQRAREWAGRITGCGMTGSAGDFHQITKGKRPRGSHCAYEPGSFANQGGTRGNEAPAQVPNVRMIFNVQGGTPIMSIVFLNIQPSVFDL